MTDVSMRDYVDTRFAAQLRAIDVAAADLHEWKREHNAFMATNAGLSSALAEIRVRLDSAFARVDKLESRGDNLDGRFWALGVVISLLTIVLNIALRYWPK